jgi:hypothetical protein
MANAAFTPRAHSLDADPVDPTTGLKRFKLPDVLDRTVKTYNVKHESPWNSYEELRCGIGSPVTVARRKNLPCDVVSVRNIKGQDAKVKLRMLQRIQHQNFVSVLEVFSFEQSFHVIFEHMPIAISYFTDIPYYPNELELASILGQVSHSTYTTRRMGTNCSRYFRALRTLCRKG